MARPRRAAALILSAGHAAAQLTVSTEPIQLDTEGVSGGLSCGDPSMVGKTVRIGFIYMGEIADVGWTYRHNEGRIFAQKMMSKCHPDTMFHSEFFEWTPKDQSVFNDYASRNFNLVIATSFKYHDETLQAALENSNTHFVHVSGYYNCQNMNQGQGWPEHLLERAQDGGDLGHCDNFITAWGKLYQSRYLAGVVAGGSSVTKKIAYVASVPIPEVLRNINTYALGAWKADPAVQVLVMWIFSFFWKDGEREAARRLIELGCDVLAYHTDTMEVPITAHQMGAMSVGSNGDVRRLVGESVLTSAFFNWGPLYKDLVNMSISGVFHASDLWYDYYHGVVTNAENSFRVSSATSQLFVDERRRLVEDKWDPLDQSANGGLRGGCADPKGPDSPTCNDNKYLTVDGNPRCGPASGVCTGDDITGPNDLSFFPGRIVHDFILEGIVVLPPLETFGMACVPGTRWEEHVDAASNSYSIQCHDCEAGTFSDFDNYEDPAFFCCEIENHPNATAAPTCTPCPAGQTTNGLTRQRGCVKCGVGFYTLDTEGHPMCSACPIERTNQREGMHGATVQVSCPVCATGYECDDGSNATSKCAGTCTLIPPPTTKKALPLGILIGVAAGLFVLILIGGGIAYWKLTESQRRIAKLFDNNRVAEECAENVASMRLEELDFLFELEKPNRIQAAFMSIVCSLKMYREYMPASVLAGDEEEAEDDVLPGGQSKSGASRSGASRVSKSMGGGASQAGSTKTMTAIQSKMAKGYGGTVGYDRKNPGAGVAAMEATKLSITKRRCTFASFNLVDFATLTRDMPVQQVLEQHTAYLSTLVAALRAWRGVPDGFVADRLYCSYGAVKDLPSHVPSAAQGTLRMVMALKDPATGAELARARQVTAGIASGAVLAGNMGCDRMKKYTAIGQAASLYHVCEQRNADFDTCVMADAAVVKSASQVVQTRPLIKIEYKKKSEVLSEVIKLHDMGEGDEWMYQLEEAEQKDPNKKFCEAMELFFSQKYKEAVEALESDKLQTPMHAKMIEHILQQAQ